jgi:hypothetical protein
VLVVAYYLLCYAITVLDDVDEISILREPTSYSAEMFTFERKKARLSVCWYVQGGCYIVPHFVYSDYIKASRLCTKLSPHTAPTFPTHTALVEFSDRARE